MSVKATYVNIFPLARLHVPVGCFPTFAVVFCFDFFF
jgi:hypothetical protein